MVCIFIDSKGKCPVNIYKSILVDYIQGLHLEWRVRAIHDVMGKPQLVLSLSSGQDFGLIS